MSNWKRNMLFVNQNQVEKESTLSDFGSSTKELKMPDEYKGDLRKNGGYTINTPREWTQKEVEWCLDLRERGYTLKQISKTIDRDLVSVSKKMKRLKVKEGTYNEEHLKDKYDTNQLFLNYLNPITILDVYSGKKSFYFGKVKDVLTNDINKNYETDFNLDSLKLLCKLYFEEKTFDLVDLDPYGSAYECFHLAIKMAKKGIIITFGEMGNKRFKRLDYVGKCYGIKNFKDFTIENLIKEVIRIGKINKKELRVWKIKDWRNISRVYFTIHKFKLPDEEYRNMFKNETKKM